MFLSCFAGSVNDCWNRLISAVSNQSYLEPSQIELYVTLCEDLISKSAPDCEEMACRFISACLGTLTSLLSSKTDHAETCQLLIGIISKFLSVTIYLWHMMYMLYRLCYTDYRFALMMHRI